MKKKNGFSESIISKKDKNKIPFFFLGPKNDWKKILNDKIKNKISSIYEQELKELEYN